MQILALRDEFADRPFADPDGWWPDQPDAVGGRDLVAGGTWCASSVASGITAAVLNRPPGAAPADGAPSRGVLPLLALQHGQRWPEFIDVTPMAGFNMVLATPDSLRWWRHDGGADVVEEALAEGTHLFRPSGRVTDPIDPLLANAELRSAETGDLDHRWGSWFDALEQSEPNDSPDAMIKSPRGEHNYRTVFGQFISAEPGRLRLDYLRTPRPGQTWTHRNFGR